jgi:hypothetical protein
VGREYRVELQGRASGVTLPLVYNIVTCFSECSQGSDW